MGICPNCGSWVDEGDICHGCGASGSYITSEDEDEDEFANMIYQEHEQYLILKGILNKTNEENITDLQNPFW